MTDQRNTTPANTDPPGVPVPARGGRGGVGVGIGLALLIAVGIGAITLLSMGWQSSIIVWIVMAVLAVTAIALLVRRS